MSSSVIVCSATWPASG